MRGNRQERERSGTANASGIITSIAKERPLLSLEEEVALGERIQANEHDLEAFHQLVDANYRLVVDIASYRSLKDQELYEELLSVGSIGLMTAAKKFDPRRGCRFSTMATSWIRQAINRYFDNCRDQVRKPVHLIERYRKVLDKYNELVDDIGNAPSKAKWADACGMSLGELEAILAAFEDPIPLDEPWEGDSGDRPVSLADILVAPESSPELEYERMELKEIIASAMDCLSDREREVVGLRYGLFDGVCQTLDNIGNRLGMSRERVRQIEGLALRRLRKPLKRKLPQSMVSDSEDTESEEQISEALALFRKLANPEGSILAPQALLTKNLYVSEKIARLIVRELEERGYLIPLRKKSRRGHLYKVINSV